MYIILNQGDTYDVFFMPGMAANSKIFEFLKFPKNFKLHFLEWFQPNEDENLKSMSTGCQKKSMEKILFL